MEVNYNPITLDVERESEERCILTVGPFRIGLSNREATRVGSAFANALSATAIQFPDAMYGCGLYDNEEEAKTVVAIVNVGRTNKDNFVVCVWTNDDKQTRMFGVKTPAIINWINALYNMQDGLVKSSPRENAKRAGLPRQATSDCEAIGMEV